MLVYWVTTCPGSRPIVNQILHVASLQSTSEHFSETRLISINNHRCLSPLTYSPLFLIINSPHDLSVNSSQNELFH